MQKNRDEYINYCKKQAWLQYEYDMSGQEYSKPDKAIINACTTMLCDLAKHPDTEKQAQSCAFLVFMVKDYDSMKRFIDGFN